MLNFESYFKGILNDLKIELTDEFDRNFERKAFFDRKWPERKIPNNKGSLLVVKGGSGLRGSIRPNIEGESIAWRSNLDYATIHNEGGDITVTAQMKKFFWAMYYKAGAAIGKGSSLRNDRLSGEAATWKALALMKVGQKIKIPQRKFIGDHPMVDASIKRVVDEAVEQMNNDLAIELQQQLNRR